MTTLIIARHGNTFESSETARRVGARTDLPLVEKGREQARAIGRYLKEHRLIPDVIYSSALQRAQETAKIAVKESGISNPVFTLDIFNEIDYGPDENKPEHEVIARIGAAAMENWDKNGIMPPGWNADTSEIISNWLSFADQVRAHDDNETILVVTSNGIARFAPHITGDFEGFAKKHPLKLATGALAIFEYKNGWVIKEWNIKPLAI
ncbi:MAG TPA: histidine phosphatase family protein [Alphaproteobacteria bacterium]|nr:histidine phosphatase family protein [Micavibrio sp.]MBK9561670.1 histidine phosphatase family protein [Micavibrio sp.]HQX27153.1 histidine phosphatase family protein [Alphaproteobacteria bacterium]